MKRLFMITLAIVWLGVNQHTYAEIKNGYDNETLKTFKESLNEYNKERQKKVVQNKSWKMLASTRKKGML